MSRRFIISTVNFELAQDVVAQAITGFSDQFNRAPKYLALAPGRVNLIGEHVDYHDGFVFPAAIDRFLCVAADVSPVVSRIVSSSEGAANAFDVQNMDSSSLTPWVRYAAGMGWVLGPGAPNVNAFIASDIPTGSGLSSSAAMEMAFGNLFRLLSHAETEDLDLALLGQVCENQFVGVPCGMMDQIAVQMGRSGQAMLIDTKQPPWVEHASLPFGVKMVVCNTGVQHQLGDSGYPLRRRQSEDAAMMLGVGTLRECSVDELIERKEELPDVLFRRAKHCVTEIERTLQFYDALKKGETAKLGPLMAESHSSLRDDYEVSSPELDKMAETAQKAPGCLGARMTGGGFGGACIALVYEGQAEEFIEVCCRDYGPTGTFFECKPVDGAFAVELN